MPSAKLLIRLTTQELGRLHQPSRPKVTTKELPSTYTDPEGVSKNRNFINCLSNILSQVKTVVKPIVKSPNEELIIHHNTIEVYCEASSG